MMKEKISEIISQIDEEYVYEATDYVKMKSKPFFEWLKGKFWIVEEIGTKCYFFRRKWNFILQQ